MPSYKFCVTAQSLHQKDIEWSTDAESRTIKKIKDQIPRRSAIMVFI